MKIQFCGAARTVTGSCHLVTLDDGYKILLDCGLYQGRDEEFADFNGKWIFNPKDIDCLILSHAHIDHCGRVPKLVKDGYSGEIVSTSATRDLSAVMLIDSAKLQERDAYYIIKKRNRAGNKEIAEPLYTPEDVYNSFQNFVGISYGVWHGIRKDVSIQLRDSGHIFGSGSVTLRIENNGKPPLYIGFSGDIGRPGRPILKDPVPMENLDYLICESTYGGERHKQLPEDEEELLRIIYETCIKNKGKLLIPAFSVGRTQEIVFILDKLEHDGRLPEIPVFVDSPMAINATEIYRMHPECFDSEIVEYMMDNPNPFGFNNLKYIRQTDDSKRLNDLDGPAVIISASGMMTGGRILHHLNNNIEDSRNTILIVGFCAPHTLGARIREGQKRVKIFGAEKNVNAKVVVMDSFSAHGDQPEMLSYLSNLDRKKLKNVFLVHGEYGRQQFFRSALEEQRFRNIDIPELGYVFEFNPTE